MTWLHCHLQITDIKTCHWVYFVLIFLYVWQTRWSQRSNKSYAKTGRSIKLHAVWWHFDLVWFASVDAQHRRCVPKKQYVIISFILYWILFNACLSVSKYFRQYNQTNAYWNTMSICELRRPLNSMYNCFGYYVYSRRTINDHIIGWAFILLY